MAIHPIAFGRFYSHGGKESEAIFKIIRIHSLGIINGWAKCHANPVVGWDFFSLTGWRCHPNSRAANMAKNCVCNQLSFVRMYWSVRTNCLEISLSDGRLAVSDIYRWNYESVNGCQSVCQSFQHLPIWPDIYCQHYLESFSSNGWIILTAALLSPVSGKIHTEKHSYSGRAPLNKLIVEVPGKGKLWFLTLTTQSRESRWDSFGGMWLWHVHTFGSLTAERDCYTVRQKAASTVASCFAVCAQDGLSAFQPAWQNSKWPKQDFRGKLRKKPACACAFHFLRFLNATQY